MEAAAEAAGEPVMAGACSCSKSGKWTGCPVHDPAQGGKQPSVSAGAWVVDALV